MVTVAAWEQRFWKGKLASPEHVVDEAADSMLLAWPAGVSLRPWQERLVGSGVLKAEARVLPTQLASPSTVTSKLGLFTLGFWTKIFSRNKASPSF